MNLERPPAEGAITAQRRSVGEAEAQERAVAEQQITALHELRQ